MFDRRVLTEQLDKPLADIICKSNIARKIQSSYVDLSFCKRIGKLLNLSDGQIGVGEIQAFDVLLSPKVLHHSFYVLNICVV